jgi:hypothetical protein
MKEYRADTVRAEVDGRMQDLTRPRGLPETMWATIKGWDFASRSPFSDSFYSKPGKSWTHTPADSLRISDHWNFESQGEMHSVTDKPVENNSHWTLARYDNGTWQVLESLPKVEREPFAEASDGLYKRADQRAKDAGFASLWERSEKAFQQRVKNGDYEVEITKREWGDKGRRLISETAVRGKLIKLTDSFATAQTESGETVRGKDFTLIYKGEKVHQSSERSRWQDADGAPMFSRVRAELGRVEGRSTASKPLAFSRRRVPDWVQGGSAALQSAASKIDTYAPEKPIAEKVKDLTANWKQRLVQGMVDSYAPLKNLSYDAYVAARMVKSADGVLEGALMYGKPVMDKDGAIVGDLDGKGFLGAMQELKGEHDRFFMWLAGNRAERLASEGRENLFNGTEIGAMKALNQGKMKDGGSREVAYMRAAETFKAYNKSILDLAEKTGLIDGASRHLWEHDFYVPFFRTMEDDALAGPSRVRGLVRQQAFQKLKGGQENLGDLMENTLRNWSHLISASLANQAASKSLQAAEKAGVALEASAETARQMGKASGNRKGVVYYMDHGKQRFMLVDDPFVLEAITSMESASFKGLPMQLMGKFKHYLTIGVTASPVFKIRNLMRDSVSAIGTNDMSYNIGKNLVEGWGLTNKNSAVRRRADAVRYVG